MKEYINKKCKLHILINHKDLFYTAIITNVTENHLSFTDKFNENYTFRLQDVIEIRELRG